MRGHGVRDLDMHGGVVEAGAVVEDIEIVGAHYLRLFLYGRLDVLRECGIGSLPQNVV